MIDTLLNLSRSCPHNEKKGKSNESFSKAITDAVALSVSHYYRHRILSGAVEYEVDCCIRVFSEQQKTEIIELNVQVDHVHLLVLLPPKVSVSDYVGIIKGRTAIRVFNKFRKLKKKPYWVNHFWARGYCVDSVGLDADMIRKYVKYQERKEKRAEQLKLF